MTGVIITRGNLDTLRDTRGAWVQRKDHVRIQGEDSIFKPRRKASEETKPAGHFDLSLLASRTVRKCFCCLSHVGCGV